MDPALEAAEEAQGPASREASDAPLVQRTADGVHYHFPVEITVMQKEGTVDVEAITDRVLEKLARQVEQLERERAGRR